MALTEQRHWQIECSKFSKLENGSDWFHYIATGPPSWSSVSCRALLVDSEKNLAKALIDSTEAFRNIERRQRAAEAMMGLFGGREAFMKLPSIDLSKRPLLSMGDSPRVERAEVTAPFIRGVDIRNRIFFAYKTPESVHVYYQDRYADRLWSVCVNRADGRLWEIVLDTKSHHTFSAKFSRLRTFVAEQIRAQTKADSKVKEDLSTPLPCTEILQS